MSALHEPITIECPTGVDVKYDDLYLSIEAEIDKLNSLSGGKDVDWRYVHDNTHTLLQERTKDVKLVVWWALSRFKLENFEGLLEGLITVNKLMQDFGEQLFPSPIRAKLGALVWFENTINTLLMGLNTVDLPANKVVDFCENFKLYRDNTQALCAVSDNFFREIIQHLEVLIIANAPKVEEVKPPSAITTVAVGDAEITNDADALKSLAALKKNAENLSRYWRQKKFQDVRALRLTRMIGWLEIDSTPPSENGKTQLNAPSAQRIEEIESLIAEGQNSEALELIETTLLRSPFWFMGQQMAHDLLMLSGSESEAAFVKNTTVSILKTYSTMSEACFRDGTVYVPINMKNWLVDVSGDVCVETTVSEFDVIKEECYGLVKNKDAKGAMDKLQHTYMSASSKEEEFKWRLLQCEVALEASKPQMALAIIDELERYIDQFSLEVWRSDLASMVYVLLLQSFNRTQVDKERFDRVYEKLCRIDSAAAMEIKLH